MKWKHPRSLPHDGQEILVVAHSGFKYLVRYNQKANFGRFTFGPGYQIFDCEDGEFSEALHEEDIAGWIPMSSLPRMDQIETES